MLATSSTRRQRATCNADAPLLQEVAPRSTDLHQKKTVSAPSRPGMDLLELPMAACQSKTDPQAAKVEAERKQRKLCDTETMGLQITPPRPSRPRAIGSQTNPHRREPWAAPHAAVADEGVRR
eukprot:CAMPEP_0198553150 /NCGR_PEP_ID=MMETSP1462-20131121/79955_1 /TAXON_ID=1333877 /ORGANISM="Brandtodinium nutriculum, Strain RCC3387" /LENGTH=122 /DNA_ID=CAMNT_0044283825 /DNA_START=117 /DNA_END=482 /DNA_ORIENTATION=-